MVVATRAFPIVILAIPLTVTFLQLGIDDTVYGVAFVHAVLALPFVVLVMAGVFVGISVELEEAAMVLGCTRPAAFRRIILPLARPGLATAAIFTFIVSPA
jgi:multiple sugar transport system permease protein